MTYWQATLAILAALSVSMALAEDFKTTNGVSRSARRQDGRRQADEGRRVVVVGQSAVSLKVFIAGIIVLVGVVWAIVRSRF